MNTAAATLGYHTQNLNLQIQRLGADLGGRLLIRGHRYQPVTPTERGRRLLDQLSRPDVRELIEEFAPPHAHQNRRPIQTQNRPGGMTLAVAPNALIAIRTSTCPRWRRGRQHRTSEAGQRNLTAACPGR
ncbi:LysR family transcriptional regulator [Micromonospora parva]|uniref:LysR family transcriptional regulator n=1 Tax=Micromonospora parva TaxID=1464048 RepID=UPI0033CC955B